MGDTPLRSGPRSELAKRDCLTSRRITTLCALLGCGRVITEYQRESSSKRPRSPSSASADPSCGPAERCGQHGIHKPWKTDRVFHKYRYARLTGSFHINEVMFFRPAEYGPPSERLPPGRKPRHASCASPSPRAHSTVDDIVREFLSVRSRAEFADPYQPPRALVAMPADFQHEITPLAKYRFAAELCG